MASCQQYFENGERNNGTFRIRPDISLPSFEVNCVFGNDSGVTEIVPLDWPEIGLVFPKNESVRCYEPNCFTKSVQYDPSLAQIEVNLTIFLFLSMINVLGINQFIKQLHSNCRAFMSSNSTLWGFVLVRSKR